MLAGLVLLVLGGAVVLLSTFVSSSFDLQQGFWSGIPSIDASYWTGLTVTNLAAAPVFERWLWIADAVVTLLCLAGAIWAVVGLASGRVPVWWPMLATGVLALLVFAVELVDWMRQDVLVFGLVLSSLGAVLVIIGAALLATAPRSSPLASGELT